MDFPELLILRHGETEWNRAGRMQGRMDSPLTAKGRDQATHQGAILRDFGVDGWGWYASPQGRAQTTAGIARGAGDLPVTTDDRLCEIGLGRWDGLSRDAIRAQAPDLFAGTGMGWYDHAPEGEGLAAVAARLRGFLTELERPAVIVTHGITSRVLRTVLLGLPVGEFDQLPGGQGVVHHVSAGVARVIA
jgi:broad specificity phosphatase PhoE